MIGRSTLAAIITLHLALCAAAFAPPRPIPTRTTTAQHNSHGGTRLLLAASSNGGHSADAPPSPALELIRSWLLARLPSLEGGELELYSACLLNDGYSTADQLGGLNSGASGRVEDLYFMRKGHRRSLAGQIGGPGNRSRRARGGSTGGKNDGLLPTRISATEVDGEVVLVEEFLSSGSADDDVRVGGEGHEEVGAGEAGGTKRNAARKITAPGAMSGPTSSPSQDEPCARPVVPSRARRAAASGGAVADRPSSGDRGARTQRSGGPVVASLSEDERCARPAVPSRPASASGGGAPDHRGPGDGARPTGRSRRGRPPDAASLSGDERCARPVASAASSRRRAVVGRVVIGGPDDGRGPPGRRPAGRSPEPVSLSDGEERLRPAPSGVGPSEYITVNDRTGDARRLERLKRLPVDASTSEVLSRATDSVHNVAMRSSLDGVANSGALSRATDSTHRNVTRSCPNKPLAAAGGETSLLKSLVGEEPRSRYSTRYQRADDALLPVRINFQPSSLRSLLKDVQPPGSKRDRTKIPERVR